MDIFTEDHAALLGEIDMLENAVGGLDGAGRNEETASHSAAVQGHDLAGGNIAEIGGADGVEGAGLAGNHPGALLGPADAQGTESIGIAGGLQPIGKQKQQRVSPLQMAEDMAEGIGLVLVRGLGQQVDDDFGIVGGLEDRPVGLILIAKEGRVDQVAVVSQGNRAVREFAHEGLGVDEGARSGGGIADMADGEGIAQPLQDAVVLAENAGDLSHAGVALDAIAIAGGDPGGFLAPMLKAVQSEIGFFHGFRIPVDSEDPAFFFDFWHTSIRPLLNTKTV